jgi:hypothetical protein
MAVYNLKSGAFLGTVATVASATKFSLSRSPGDESGASLLLSAYGGCGPGDYFGGGLGVSSGIPSDRYWDNCIWGSRNVTISGNAFSLDAGTVTGCTKEAMCGVMAAISFNAGVPTLMQFFNSYQKHIADASGGLGNVWSGNAYTWTGGGAGDWRFQAGAQGTTVTRSQWQASPYGQDAGSSFRIAGKTRQPLSALMGAAKGPFYIARPNPLACHLGFVATRAARAARHNLLIYLGGDSRLHGPGVASCPVDASPTTQLPFVITQNGLQGGSQAGGEVTWPLRERDLQSRGPDIDVANSVMV